MSDVWIGSQKMWLYRTCENDDDGDPLDFGVVRADTEEEAYERVAAHLGDIGTAGWDGGIVSVKFYEVTGWNQHNVIESKPPDEVGLEIPEEA
jgi:hypothetical protein